MRNIAVAAVLLALASRPAQSAAPTTRELLRFVPAAAEVIVAMDAAALRDHPTVQTWLLEHQSAWSSNPSDAQEFLREAGLDPLHDVDSMVVAVVPRPGADHGLAAFGGRFDPASLSAALTKRGCLPVAIGGMTALRLQDPQHTDPNAPLVYLTQDVVLAADEETLRAAIAAPAQVNALVGREVAAGRLDTRMAFWMVATVPARLREAAKAPVDVEGDGTAEVLRGMLLASRTVQRVTMQASLDDALTLAGWAEADTEENAGLLRDTIKGAIAAARLHLQDQSPELVDVLRDIKVAVDGREVKGSTEIPLALLEKLVADRHRRCAEQAAHPN